MNDTTSTDVWASTDHDPLSCLNNSSHSTAENLQMARTDIEHALAATGNTRIQYAMSARDYAITVLLASDADTTQRHQAGHCLRDALIITG
jgi:hypothetical protein